MRAPTTCSRPTASSPPPTAAWPRRSAATSSVSGSLSSAARGCLGTWRARVDAATGNLEELTDINAYGKITGGVRKTDGLPADTVLPMPYANYATSSYANSAGLFGGSTGTTTLNGQYVRIVDSCGSISKAANARERSRW